MAGVTPLGWLEEWAWLLATVLCGASLAGVVRKINTGRKVTWGQAGKAAATSFLVGGIAFAYLWETMGAVSPGKFLAFCVLAGAGGADMLELGSILVRKTIIKLFPDVFPPESPQ